jgi:hypothetical protein
MSKQSQRLVGILGIVFFILEAVVLVLPAPPTSTTAPADIVRWYSDNRSLFLAINYLGALGVVPQLFVVGAVWRLLRRAEGDGGWIHSVFLASAAVAAALSLVEFWLFQALGQVETEIHVYYTLFKITNLLWAFVLLPVAAQSIAAGWIIVRNRALPVWLGYFAILVALACLVVSYGAVVREGPLVSGDYASLGAFSLLLLWYLGVSITLLVRPRHEEGGA